MYLIILGPPGAGKGTQSLRIAERLGLKHLSTGDILRKAVAEGTELGLKAKRVMERGELVSDEIMIGIIKNELSSPEVKKGFILDGFPRTLEQAKQLDKILSDLGYEGLQIIDIIVSDEELVKRLLGRGRSDDTIETINNRLAIYKKQTMPVKEYYSEKYVVYNIEGTGSIDEITHNILKILKWQE
ncbi:MAG: adenylate kinase [Ignavibacteria bacterium]|nr:adenylate kinase [Ignavibacteria bacterium]